MIIGLTGGIASGKSTVSSILKEWGAVVIDGDVVAREIVGLHQPALKEIAACFGNQVLNEDGTLNRNLLGELVFSDPVRLEQLNRITHPVIYDRIRECIHMLVNQGERAIIVDAALLYTLRLNELVDAIWYVDANEELKVERLSSRNGYSRKEALDRIQAQETTGRQQADEIIKNEGTLASLMEQLALLWKKYMEK